MKINKTTVDAIKPPDAGTVFYWDDKLSGFGLRVTHNRKSYIVQGRVNRKTRRQKLGKHGVLAPDQARRMAHTALGNMASGIDTVKEKKAERAAHKANSVTLAEMWAEYAQANRGKDGKPKKQSTISHMDQHLRRNFAEWMDQPIADITEGDVYERHQTIAERSGTQADQACRYLRAIMSYAVDNDRLKSNPVGVLRKRRAWHNLEPRDTRIEPDQLGPVIVSLEDFANYPGALQASADLTLFLLFTGLRLTEAASLTWADVDGDSIRLSDPKNRKPVVLPLSSEAVAVLARRDRADDYVFASRTGTHLKDTRGVRKRVEADTGATFTNHDLRRTFASVAGELDIGVYTLKSLLNHAVDQADVTAGYVNTGDDSKRQAADRVGSVMRSQVTA